jgi:hypothetical protein
MGWEISVVDDGVLCAFDGREYWVIVEHSSQIHRKKMVLGCSNASSVE